jgi:hypothetical protein
MGTTWAAVEQNAKGGDAQTDESASVEQDSRWGWGERRGSNPMPNETSTRRGELCGLLQVTKPTG